jgi:general secretion pathway protein M
VTSSASALGLTVAVQPVAGGVRVTIAQGSYDAVMNWLADLARTSTLAATSVDLQRGGAPGQVTATVEFRG